MHLEALAIDMVHRRRPLVRFLELSGLLDEPYLPGLGVVMSVRQLPRLGKFGALNGRQKALGDQILAARHIVRDAGTDAAGKRHG